MYGICAIQDFTKSIIMRASALRDTYSVSFWDSVIIASAIESKCNILATEDLQDGLIIENTTITNIFKGDSHGD
jgi:predicted nucleic acid-binding protein